jgi:hypothetical protein
MNPISFERLIKPLLPFLFGLWMIIVLYLTIAPPTMIKTASTIINPGLGHVILFGGWTLLLGFTLLINLERKDLSLFVLWISGILFGACIELMQYLMPFGRSGSFVDIGLNTIGCTIAVYILAGYRKLRESYLPQ